MKKIRYKALILDFDGTLARGDLTVSFVVKQGIKKILNQRVVVSIATGRPYQGVIKRVTQELGLTSSLIVRAGAEIVDSFSGKLLWSENLDKQEAQKIYEYLKAEDFVFSVESKDTIYVTDDWLKAQYGTGIMLRPLEELRFDNVAKIVVPLKTADLNSGIDIDATQKKLQAHFLEVNVIRAGKPGDVVLDITSKKANKKFALIQLLKLHNLSKNDVVGVGDGYNDIPLIEICGYKIAMENAPDDLKRIVDMIIPNVENDGLLTVFRKIFNS